MVGHYCAVPHCHNQVSRDPVRFFKIIRKNEKQTNLWVKAINRLESDGITPWAPKAKSAICSAHFEGDSFSKDPNHIDYVPTLFLTKNSTETYIQKSRNVKKSNSNRIVIKKEGEKFVEIHKNPHMEEDDDDENGEFLPIKVEMPENLEEIDENLDPSRYVDSELIDTHTEEEGGTYDSSMKTSPTRFLGKEAFDVSSTLLIRRFMFDIAKDDPKDILIYAL